MKYVPEIQTNVLTVEDNGNGHGNFKNINNE